MRQMLLLMTAVIGLAGAAPSVFFNGGGMYNSYGGNSIRTMVDATRPMVEAPTQPPAKPGPSVYEEYGVAHPATAATAMQREPYFELYPHARVISLWNDLRLKQGLGPLKLVSQRDGFLA